MGIRKILCKYRIVIAGQTKLENEWDSADERKKMLRGITNGRKSERKLEILENILFITAECC